MPVANIFVLFSERGSVNRTYRQYSGSVTSCIGKITGIVAKQYELNPEKIIWIEHHLPNERYRFRNHWGEETFDLVELRYDSTLKLLINKKQDNKVLQTPFKDPKWKPLTPAKALEIILTGKL